MAPSIRFFGVVLTAFFLLWVSPSKACDGVQATCPPKIERLNTHWIADDGSHAMRGSKTQWYPAYRGTRVFESKSAAMTDFIGWINSGPTGVCSASPLIYITYSGWAVEGSTAMYDEFCGNVKRGRWGVTIYVGAEQDFYKCENPVYPRLNPTDKMCYKSDTCRAGSTEWSSYTNIAAKTVCVDMENGSSCKGRPDGVSVCSGNPEKCWSNIILSGENCPAADANKGPQDKCTTAPDGRKVCSSDSSNPDAQSGPCVQTDRGVICAKTESPQSNCQKNPVDPACTNPNPNTKCGFVGSTLVCSDAPNNCGTMAGQSVCICSNGGSRPWGGGASSCASGGGTDPVVGGGGGSGKEQKINFAGRCGSGDTLNLDCFFENSTDIKPQKGTPEFTELDQATQKIGEPFEHGIGEGAGLFAGVMPGTGSCPALSLDGIPHVGNIAIRMPCDQMTLIRLGFEWLLNIGVIWYVWRRFSETI